MTEENQKNRDAYLNLCKNVWDFDKESMDYIEKRTSDEWKFPAEFEKLFNIKDAKVEDQRIRFDMDMGNKEIQKFFEKDDQAYKLFKSKFESVLYYLNDYSCNIQYKEFIDNKCIFKKNTTKIKKVFETVYAEKNEAFERDSGHSYDKEYCANWIVTQFEKIGACKKSAKKLQFVISFNPMDWLLSSTGETWGSCFNLNNSSGGFRYCLGIPFLCGDKNRMLLYITDGSKKEFQGIKTDHYQTRTWCLLDKSNEMAIVKWYPNDTIGVAPVKAITKLDCFVDHNEFYHSKYNVDVLSTKKGAVIGVYSDMGRLTEEDGKLWFVGNDKDGQQVFYKNLIEVTDASNTSINFERERGNIERLLGIEGKLGFNINQWVKYGYHVDKMFPTLRCNCCGEEKVGAGLSDGFLCYDCYKKNYFTCGKCHGTFNNIKTKATKIETTTGETINVCSECLRNIKVCDYCGKYSKTGYKNVDGGTVICNECLDSRMDFDTCSNCGKVSKNIKITFNTFSKDLTKSCSNCSEETSFNSLTFGRYYQVLTGKKRGISIE